MGKKILTVILILVLVAVGTWYYLSYFKKTGSNNTNTTVNNTAKPVSYSHNGKVTAINNNNYTLLLADNKTSKTFTVSSTTEVKKRVVVKGSTSFNLVAAGLSDIKQGTELIVYLTESANSVNAESLEIIK